jgi:hypothetical protein
MSVMCISDGISASPSRRAAVVAEAIAPEPQANTAAMASDWNVLTDPHIRNTRWYWRSECRSDAPFDLRLRQAGAASLLAGKNGMLSLGDARDACVGSGHDLLPTWRREPQ